MASSSGRYQSRLFNGFSATLNHLTKLKLYLRRVKIGATWGAQTLAYLAYGLIQVLNPTQQSRRLVAGKDSTIAGNKLLASAEEPFQQAILAVTELYYPSQVDEPASLPKSYGSTSLSSVAIQGVATELVTRHLVLVTTSNEPLDLLTPNQQKQIHRRIFWAIFNYRCSTRFTQVTRSLGWFKPSSALISQQDVTGIVRQRSIAQRIQALFWRSTGPEPVVIKTEVRSIPAFIRAAMTYFNRHPRKLLPNGSFKQLNRRNSPPFFLNSVFKWQRHRKAQLGEGVSPEPWLTSADLFGPDPVTLTSAGGGIPTANATAQGQQAMDIRTLPPKPYSVTNGDWLDIDTEATTMGYVKHPLEQVLDWLDRAMIWFEESLAKLWLAIHPYISALGQRIQQYRQR